MALIIAINMVCQCYRLKYFQSDLTRIFQRDVLAPAFRNVYTAKPGASRAESSECYFVCKGFRGDDRRKSDYYEPGDWPE